MDKTNSQPKSSTASVGSDQPIEVPEHPSFAAATREQPQPPNEPARPAQQPSTSGRRDAQARDDESGPRHRRYYDDSDDMIERVRRARAAFEKKTKAFQGPDWPHYEKRVIVGQRKKSQQLAPRTPGTARARPRSLRMPPQPCLSNLTRPKSSHAT